MSEPMHETAVSYLKRVLPDLEDINIRVHAAINDADNRSYNLSLAVSKTQKLLEDLTRAAHAPAILPGGNGDPV